MRIRTQLLERHVVGKWWALKRFRSTHIHAHMSHQRATGRTAQSPVTLVCMSRRRSPLRGDSFDSHDATRPEPDGYLPAALLALGHAVSRLVTEQVRYQAGEMHTAPCLVDQLAGGIAGTQGSGRGHAARSLPLIWVDVVDKLDELDATLSAWERGLPPMRPKAIAGLTTVGRMRALAERAWGPQDVRQISQCTAVLVAWADDIERLLHPAPRVTLNAPCPVCEATTVHRTDSAGERVRVPALSIDTEACRCGECAAEWTADLFEHLARLLDSATPEHLFANAKSRLAADLELAER